MQPEFWKQRWREGRIGFHLPEVNPHLREHAAHLGAPREAASILVPLCGKTLDMRWLAEQGHRVVGVDVSDLACQTFFEENGLAHQVSTRDGFACYAGERVTLLCGDFFGLEAATLGPVSGAWDRAALIALPPELRGRYVRKLASLLPAGTGLLMVGVEYPQDEMQGPPFSVPDTEVRALLADAFRIEAMTSHDALQEFPRFRDAGLSALQEHVYRVTRA